VVVGDGKVVQTEKQPPPPEKKQVPALISNDCLCSKI
jgi:hypothetical protein